MSYVFKCLKVLASMLSDKREAMQTAGRGNNKDKSGNELGVFVEQTRVPVQPEHSDQGREGERGDQRGRMGPTKGFQVVFSLRQEARQTFKDAHGLRRCVLCKDSL